jgi:cleavage and polyadenylation specificity factor subunit 2
MARIVTLEDIEGTRDEQDVPDDESPDPQVPASKKYIATVSQVHEAYDAVNTLRYSQPTHLQG